VYTILRSQGNYGVGDVVSLNLLIVIARIIIIMGGVGLTMHKHKHSSGSGLSDGLQDAVCGAPHISLPPEKNRFLALQLPELELPLA